MTKKQLAVLFTCSLITLIVGNGLLGLLPVYATRLGADPANAGYYLSFSFLGLTAGTISSGWLSDRIQRRKLLLVISGVIAAPVTWLMGQASTMTQLVLYTAIVWFFAGVGVTMVSALIGLFAGEAERGRIFGIVGLTSGLGGVIGGVASGAIVDHWGFPTLFTATALLFALQPLVALLADDRPAPLDHSESSVSSGFVTSTAFWLLFFASILVFMTNSETILARPLIMDKLHFDATAISSTVSVSGLITLPLPFLVGWLSDRFGRKVFLALIYFGSTLGMVLLILAVVLWHFWMSSIFGATINASIVLGSALVTDLVPRKSLGAALSLFTATNWIAFVIGFAGTGVAIQSVGMIATLSAGILFPLIAILLLIPLRQPTIKVTDSESALEVA